MAHENDGHRARLRERMIKEGLDSFQDHEVLELLLFQYLPRKDTNKLAHTLLDKFGSFAGVLNASPQQLMTVEGVSEATACNLAVLKEVWRRYKRSDVCKVPLDGLKSIIEYSQSLLVESYSERLVIVYVDYATRFIFREEITSDSMKRVFADNKQIVATAMRTGAAGVVLFHCHVSGVCEPSEEDDRFTERLAFALAGVDVVLLEHIIFNERNEYYSYFAHGTIDAIQSKYKNTLK